MPTSSVNSTQLFNSGTLNFAHRGYTAFAPENTLASIQAAIDLGVDGVEFDVRTCKSGEVVVFHDPELKRMTNSDGFVKDFTLAELQQFKIKQDADETKEVIPTLDEVLQLVSGKLALNIEIKADFLPENHNIEKKVTGLLKKHKVENKTIVSSFHPFTLRKLMKVDSSITRGFLFEGHSILGKLAFNFSWFLKARSMHVDVRVANSNFIKKIVKKEYGCVVWTVNSAEKMRQLISDGVNIIITDKPDLLKEIKTSASYA